MERAGIGARTARALPWCENEKEAFQHHAEYLKRLSKLREELIQQEQSNLANALERLRMRSYGKLSTCHNDGVMHASVKLI